MWAVVVAAGSGSRFGGHKQFALLGGRPVGRWSVEACRSVAAGVVAVVPRALVGDAVAASLGADAVVPGGPSRSASVRAGLAAVPEEAGVVVIHDAARPLAAPRLFEAAVGAVRAGASGAVCAVPVSDTLKAVAAGMDAGAPVVERTVAREGLVAVQTPQAFDADTLRAAHRGGGEATDDAALVEALGLAVWVVEGDPSNLKLTGPHDLAYAEFLLGAAP